MKAIQHFSIFGAEFTDITIMAPPPLCLYISPNVSLVSLSTFCSSITLSILIRRSLLDVWDAFSLLQRLPCITDALASGWTPR